ncbi:MAG: AAA family ATPase [Oscillatoriales cyanobacterium SM2_3_0]|nr:AAA family ATPase [Oscillatoriales cyanobacterium SM2_3_0]
MSVTFLQFQNYEITDCLHAGSKTLVYRATRILDRQPVVLKMLCNEHPSFKELIQFQNQYTIVQDLYLAGVVHPIALEPYRNSLLLVMPDDGSVSLSHYLNTQKLKPKDHLELGLNVGLQLAKTLDDLHQNRIIHKDIKPQNIIIHPHTLAIKVIDFSIASQLPQETKEIQNPSTLEGTLTYISPEQTGRMNRGIDYRSDFYSLGITLYELFTGQLPFQSDNPLELVYAHMAQTPTPISKLNPEVPEAIMVIVEKLMAKNAEARYQSAVGLKADFADCLNQWQKTGTIQHFTPGKLDEIAQFNIPQKLYGRETQVKLLQDAFERISQGSFELVLIGGYSGVGKTALVNEILQQLTRSKGYFSSGKFDQFQRNVPMSVPIKAFQRLVRELLTENQERLDYWRDRFLTAMRANAQLMIDVIPELELIIGKQLLAPEVGATEAAVRLGQTFNQFAQAFNSIEHPHICFIDDMQWADSTSLQSLQAFLTDPKNAYFLMVSAYRDNEVGPTHPFVQTIESLRQAGVKITDITLEPLQLMHVAQLVADTLHTNIEVIVPLASLLHEKTNGNPFFLTQLLKSLYEDGLIWFDVTARKWQWDLAQIQQQGVTDNVVELMTGRIDQLPKASQNALSLAAYIGNQFDLQTLATSAERSVREMAQDLWPGIREGFIIPLSEAYKAYQTEVETQNSIPDACECTYRFLHDRVQQAAYELIPEQQKQKTHYHIGQLLLQQIPPEIRGERIFELVGQLNYGTALVSTQAERDELASLNLVAAQRAKNAAAHQAAFDYAQIGLNLLGENAWQRCYEIILILHDLATELAYLTGNPEIVEEYTSITFEKANSPLDQANACRIKILSSVAHGQFTAAINTARQFLQEFGVIWPETPTLEDTQRAVSEVVKLLEDTNIEDLVHLPLMTDQEKIAIIQIVSSIIPAAYVSGSPLFPIIVSLCTKLSIQYGNTPNSIVSYIGYSVVACNFLKDVNTGVKLGQLAIDLVAKLEAKAVESNVVTVAGLFILHRKSHLNIGLKLLQNSYVTALEIGNLEFAGYSAHAFCFNSFWSGKPLLSLESETRAYCTELTRLNQLNIANWCRVYWQPILNLLGYAENPTILSGEAMRESEFLPKSTENHDLWALCTFHLYKLMLCNVLGEIQLAQEQTARVRYYLININGTIAEPAFYFYDSLTVLASVSSQSENTSELLQQVEENQAILQQQWANHAPMNHQHKVDLVEAEKCRVLGQKAEAIELYDKAIVGAKKNEYLQEEAIANELAAKFYLKWGKEKIAQSYLIEAYYCYGRWGAKAKTDQLGKQYPELLTPIFQQKSVNPNPCQTHTTTGRHTSQTVTSGSTSISHLLDLTSLMKASQALSGEIELEKLVTKLMQVILENAGATQGVLLINRDQQLTVEVVATQSSESSISIRIMQQTLSLEESSDIPLKLVNLVKRQLEPLVIDDVLNHAEWTSDSYLIQQQPKSLICLPILSHGKLLAILYLENQLMTGAFTSERVEVIKLLCSQAAISLENAELYQKSQDYAHQLEQSLTQLQETQVQLVQSEKMSALGEMMSGITHEINNPLGFVSGNIGQVEETLQELFEYLQLYQQYHPPGEEVMARAEEIELEYLLEDLPEMVTSMKVGINRIRDISKSMRIFSRADQEQTVEFELYENIDSTLLILSHRLKANEKRPQIQVIKKYGELPKIHGFPGQLNQVFMNILANTVDVFDEMSEGRSIDEIKQDPYQITLKTELDAENQVVEVRIRDNGCGMSEEIKAKVFEHLFTTKEVGKGTGLGLSIARQIVVDKHGGQLICESTPGVGTEFMIQIPV